MVYTLQGKSPQLHPSVYLAPGAQLIGDVVAEENVTIWFNAVLRGDNDRISIGKNSNIQDGTVVHIDPGYPVYVGQNVTVGHNVTLHGCTIEDGALIGMGATILNGAIIGKGALVAAGALVGEKQHVEPGTLVAGVPAKRVKALSERIIARFQAGSQHYIEKGRLYQAEQIEPQ